MITVLGEATTPHGAQQRHLRTPDGQRWVISACRGRFFPQGQTLVLRADEHGDHAGDDVVEMDGVDLDAAQAEFERRYQEGTLPEPPAPLTDPEAATELASGEACERLRQAIRTAQAGRLRIVPDADL